MNETAATARPLIERLRELEKIALIDKPLIREAIEALSAVSETATHELFLGKKQGDSISHFCHKCGAKNVIELKAPLSAIAVPEEVRKAVAMLKEHQKLNLTDWSQDVFVDFVDSLDSSSASGTVDKRNQGA